MKETMNKNFGTEEKILVIAMDHGFDSEGVLCKSAYCRGFALDLGKISFGKYEKSSRDSAVLSAFPTAPIVPNYT